MSLLENITNSLKNGWTIAKEKGELGARIGRLRLEMLRLERERDQGYTRLGRAYHANAKDTAGLEPLMLEIDRVAQIMRDRESVMAQLLEQDNQKNSARNDTLIEEPLNFAAETTES